ncbi:hypothetical protein HNQ57_002713 [Zhongshania antarctica]|uniref:Uncharacterized protein n=1 Tax=Zhongshania antarctica TaxID=641702 RepID=A0A840R7W6_9GAMM|nr:hypothetical protein [Zhongshania antarctica]MBB5188431.1 hypothetical protein [Zhongshania antarctica]
MRLVVIVGLCHVLMACQAREPALSGMPVEREQVVQKMVVLEEKSPSSIASAAAPLQTLDLSLPRVPDVGVQDVWDDVTRSRYGVGGWFNASAGREDARLKVKSKLLLKEAVESEYSFSSFADSVSGAEVGFEYKTR